MKGMVINLKNTVKKSPYATFSMKPIKAPNIEKNATKAITTKGADLRVKGAR